LVGADRPCYGLQARGLYGDAAPHETFEEAAADYLVEMRSVQPHGPYLLAGFSGGGITAYEIARQLQDAGEEVAFLGLLDTPLANDQELTLRDRALIHWQRIAREKHRYLTNFLADRLAWEWNKFRRRISGDAPPPPSDRFHSEAIEGAFRRACLRYQTPSLDRAIALFRPKLRPTHVLGPDRMINADRRFIYHDNGWSRYVRKVDVVEVPGDHDGMVLEPSVRVLGAKLRKAIAEAEAAATRRNTRAVEPETPVPAMYG
jgi:thioesterase domain-containing protein